MTDAWSCLSSRQVGTALGRAWAGLGDEVAVIPMGKAGDGFQRALADLPEAGRVDLIAPEFPAAGEDQWSADSAPLGHRLAELPVEPGRHQVIELAEAPWRDGGRGMIAYLRGHGHLLGAGRWPGPLTLVTTSDQACLELTGLRGVVSVEGRAEGMDPARMLSLDQDLCDWARELTGDADAGAAPGTGAAGGIGLAISALGGRITTGPRLLLDLAGARRSAAEADLVVTGCEELNFGTLGGEVVAEVLELAEPLGVPVIAVPLASEVSARELRQAGLEAATPLDCGPVTGPQGLPAITAAAGPVARTWHW
ncbi:glycerate kinase [Acidipropionibacterium virtanenii]|uniref:glycerate kinase n=1 Tax=Acidipropionibacterium virtanenii TaxID=2057246 RepID=UPI0011BF2D60|nr:glycerate kinase [Acidipropionibacterium virtanenii]